MKVLLVSIFMPSKENRGGPTQPLYDVARFAPDGVEIDLLSYVDPATEVTSDVKDIFGKVWIVNPKKMNAVSYMLSMRLPRRIYEPLKDIDYSSYDLIWLYPEWLYPEFNQAHPNMVVSGMDCSVMLYARSLYQNPWYRTGSMISKLLRAYSLERSVKKHHAFHVMGKPDEVWFKRLNKQASCFYAHHPLPPFRVCEQKMENKSLVVGITGGYSRFYHATFFQDLLKTLSKKEKIQGITWSFLGKGWGFAVNGLRDLGYEVMSAEWAESFDDYMDGLDIHFVPIMVGGGTKGKVLLSAASGVITMGTQCAFDNILDRDSMLKFQSADEASALLMKASDDLTPFRTEMKQLTEEVLVEFKPETVVSGFWKLSGTYVEGKEL